MAFGDLVRRKRRGAFLAELDEARRLARGVGQEDSLGNPVRRQLRGEICGRSQEQRLAIAVAAVVDGERQTGIDADAHLGARDVLVVVAGLRQHVNDELADRDGAGDALLSPSVP